MPNFGGYDFALVGTCGLTRFSRVFPCTKHTSGEETIKILLEEWCCVYWAPKEINSDEDVRVRSDTGWCKRVLRSLNVQVSTEIPYSHTVWVRVRAMLERVRERQWNKKNKHQVPASYQEGDWVLVHHSQLPAWPRSTSNDPYFRPYKILFLDRHRITVRCSPRLGGTLLCAAQHLKR